MDIAFVNRMAGITRGGGEIWDLKMAEGLEELGAKVTFYVGKPLQSDLPEPIEGFETVAIQTPHLRDLAYAAPPGVGGALSHLDSRIFCRRAAKAIQQRDHDFVQICSRPHFAQYIDRINAPVSIVMHGEPYSLWYDVLKPWGSTYDLLEEFHQVIAVEGATQAIEEHCSCSVEKINPGVDTDQFSPGEDALADAKRLLFIGRFVPAKNLTLLVEAFDAVIENHPDAELLLVGDGPRRDQIERAVDRRGLHRHVEFRGYVPNEELPEVYRSASAFVLSSTSEHYPITLLEAMSCGTPVVAPSIGAIPEIVEDERTGLLYTADAASEFTVAIDRVLSDSELRASCGQLARKTALNEFDWAKYQTELFELYKKVIRDIQENQTRTDGPAQVK
jgi:glycosyltransferase involved in cell wall biosynthesis